MYIQNPEYKKIAFSMIAQIEQFKIVKNEKFNICLQTISNAIINPLKISYIKKEKILKLIEHANITITEPTPEQRNKYYNACTLRKFANHYFLTDGITPEQLTAFNDIVKQATAAANLLLPKTLHILDAEHIPQIYNHKYNNERNKEPFTIGKIEGLYIGEKSDINASCMQGKPAKYFELYTDLNEEESTLKMAILTQGNEIVARALVWIDKAVTDIDRRKKQHPRHFYIDRIYTKTQEHRAETQTQLYNDLIKHFNIETNSNYFLPDGEEPTNKIHLPPCYNRYDIVKKIEAQQNTIKQIVFSNSCPFDVELSSYSYNYYPYADTFQNFDTNNQTISSDQSRGSEMLRLENTNGDAEASSIECEHCGYDIDEDNSIYIEEDEISVCEDCATYCEDRENYILTDNAIYNSHSGQHHHRDDLDI
tara:strand:- start:189 stop:1457 length:1269 start_codon:yes stop_codon:yes gene_type:complete